MNVPFYLIHNVEDFIVCLVLKYASNFLKETSLEEYQMFKEKPWNLSNSRSDKAFLGFWNSKESDMETINGGSLEITFTTL